MVLFYPWITIPEQVKTIAIPNDVHIFVNKKSKWLVYDDNGILLVVKLNPKQSLDKIETLLHFKEVHDYGDMKFIYPTSFLIAERDNNNDISTWRINKAVASPYGHADSVLIRVFIKEINFDNGMITIDNDYNHFTKGNMLYSVKKLDNKPLFIRKLYLEFKDNLTYKRETEILLRDFSSFKYKVIKDKSRTFYH